MRRFVPWPVPAVEWFLRFLRSQRILLGDWQMTARRAGALWRWLRRWLHELAPWVTVGSVVVALGLWLWGEPEDVARDCDDCPERVIPVGEDQVRDLTALDAAGAELRRLAELRRPGRVFRDNCDGCPKMVIISPGTFMMGSLASEAGHRDSERPLHRVTLGLFALGVTEVTFDQWEACVRGGGCNGYRPDDEDWGRGGRPVINVSWVDAQAYVSWLSKSTRAQYRLPSESEWEYAARAGTMTPFHTGLTISTDQANYSRNFFDGSVRRMTTPVGTFDSNAFRLDDVHGNVYEWVEDCWYDN